MTGGLGSWPEITPVTGGLDKCLVDTSMTGGLDQTSYDWGTLVFLMGRPFLLMKFQESSNFISNWVQDEHANKTLSLLQGSLMPLNHPMPQLMDT